MKDQQERNIQKAKQEQGGAKMCNIECKQATIKTTQATRTVMPTSISSLIIDVARFEL
jgi:hypothetical protein